MDIGAWGAWSHKESDMVEPIDDVMKIKKLQRKETLDSHNL